MTDFKNKASFEGAKAIRATPACLVCVIDGEEVLVPESQIDDDSEVYEVGGEGTLVVSEWWAMQRGLV